MNRVSMVLLMLLAVSFSSAQVTGAGSVGHPGVLIGNERWAVEGTVPFSADVVTEITRVLADGNQLHQERHGKTYRDSQGRLRTEDEVFTPAGKMKHITISDPIQHVLISLHPAMHTAEVHHTNVPRPPLRPAPAQRPPQQSKPSQLSIVREKLGTMDIEGFTVTERLSSPELGMVLLEVNDDPQSGKESRKLVNIQRAEPDSWLFQIPPDYAVRDQNPQQ